MQKAVTVLQSVLDPRMAFRFAILMSGMLLAGDRRTASAWFTSAGVQDDWDRFYDCLIRVGRVSAAIATALLGLVVTKFSSQFSKRVRAVVRAAEGGEFHDRREARSRRLEEE